MDNRLSSISFFDLQVLSELSGHQSLRALSRALRIEPPALSKKLKSIQGDLRVEILKTSPMGYSLTPDGIHISTQSKLLLQRSIDFIPSRNKPLQVQETLTVGTRGFLNYILAGHFLKATEASGQTPLLRFIDLSPEEIRHTIYEGVLDVALSIEQFPWPKTWTVASVGHLRWSIYVAEAHPIPSQASKEDILKYPWVKAAYWNGRAIAHAPDAISIPSQERLSGNEMQTAMTAIEICKCTDNIALIPDIVAQASLDKGEIRRIQCSEVELPMAEISLGVRSDKISQKLFKAWSDAIRKAIP